MARRLLDGPFQAGPRRGVLIGGEALVVADAAQNCLVRGQLVGALAPKSFAHASRQNTIPVGDRGDNPRNNLVLKLESRFRFEGAVVSLGPEMGSGVRVYKLHRNAQ